MDIRGWIKEQWPGWVASGIVGTVGYNLAMAGLGVMSGSYPDLIGYAFGHPWQVAVWSASWFGLGVMAGLLRNGRRREIRRADDHLRDECDRLSTNARWWIPEALSQDEVSVLKFDGKEAFSALSEAGVSTFLHVRNVNDGYKIIYLREEVRGFFRRNPDVLSIEAQRRGLAKRLFGAKE